MSSPSSPRVNDGVGVLPLVIEVEKDLDRDRYLEYSQFVDFINFLPPYSKSQCYYLVLGMTGFRPIEVSKLTLNQLEFTDKSRATIVNRITKTKKKTYYDSKGRVIATKQIKIKRRIIPSWVAEYIEEYIKRNYNQLKSDDNGSFYLFSTPYNSRLPYVDTQSWNVDLSKWRKRLVQDNFVKWSWIFEPAYFKIINGKKSPVYRLSLYSFRRSRATWFAAQLLEKGISDVLLTTSQFMGHSRLNTTYVYIKNLIAEKNVGNPSPICAPDLSENILKKEKSKQTKLSKWF